MKSLGECKQEPFFAKELHTFMQLHGETPDQELFIMDNYWNPYFIIQNYAPLQLLFDEIYASRNLAAQTKSSSHPTENTNNKRSHAKPQQQQQQQRAKVTTVLVENSCPPPPPPPPEIQSQPLLTSQQVVVSPIKSSSKDSNSSSSAASSSSCSATRTTASIPNSSASTAGSDVVVAEPDSISYESSDDHRQRSPIQQPVNKRTTGTKTITGLGNRNNHHHRFGDESDGDQVDEYDDEYDEEERCCENDDLTGFTKF